MLSSGYPETLQNKDFEETLNVEEPAVVRGKGRPKGSRNKKQKTFDNSTRREPSSFELAQASLKTIATTSSSSQAPKIRSSLTISEREEGVQGRGIIQRQKSSSVPGVPEHMMTSFRI